MSLECQNGPDCHLRFGVTAPTFTPLMGIDAIPLTIISRGISTVSLCPNFPTTASEMTTIDTATTELSTTVNTDSTDAYEATSTPILVMAMSSQEDYILDYISGTQTFSNIYDVVSH